jgi:N-acetylmuramoyl-L-alanine amidase
LNNKRSYIYFLSCFLLIVAFCGKVNLVQAANYDDKGIKLDVDNNKSWVVKFNKELDNSTIDDSKFVVTDQDGQQMPVEVKLGEDEKSVVVSPKNEYNYGKTYNLFIKDGIKSKSKNGLIKTAKMQFTVKNNSSNDFNKDYTVCIDPGHGGTDTGNVGQAGVKEKDIDLSVALKVGKILEDSGVKVVYTRKTDSISWSKDNDLKSRFDVSNNAKSDFFVSIHCNAYPDNLATNGIETYYSESDSIGQKLAKSVQSGIVSNTNLVDRGIKVGLPQHEILRGTNATAIMVELGFLTNLQEEKIIGSEDFQNKSSAAIANGILSSLKLVDKNNNVTISSISDLSMSAAQGTTFTLPLTVTANMSDGTSKEVSIIWKDKAVSTTELGSYCYKGNVAGYSKDITLTLAVVDKVDIPQSTTSEAVCIDPGHGLGSDTGATGIEGLQEDDVTLAVGLKVGKILENNGVKVVYTRTEDMRSTPMSVVDSLQKRCDISNNANAKYFVCIHANSFDSSAALGTETLYNTGNQESEKLATAIQNSIVEEVGTYDRGLKDGNWLYVVNHTNATSVLTELGFLTNPSDAEKLKDDSYQQKYAQAIADGILQCLGK